MRINFEAVCRVPDEDLERNVAHAKSLGLPLVEAGAPSLAIVGGGSSILRSIPKLKAWDGDIWSINGAWQWCVSHGIESKFYSVDAKQDISELCEGSDAVLSLRCHPDVFSVCESVRVISHDTYGPTSASTAPIHAIRAGYSQVTFFGCEGSYEGKTHAYKNENRTLLKVLCNGEEFLTSPQMLMQTEFLGEQIRAAPNILKDESGGLLSAYVNSPEIDVIAGPKRLLEKLLEEA